MGRRILVVMVLVGLAVASGASTALAAKAGSSMQSAITINAGTSVNFNARGGRDTVGGPCGINSHPVWFEFVAPASQTYNVNTLGSHYDTVLIVYSWQGGSLHEIGCNDNAVLGAYCPAPGENLCSDVQFSATSEMTYYFVVAAKNGSRPGKGTLTVGP